MKKYLLYVIDQAQRKAPSNKLLAPTNASNHRISQS